MEKPQQCLSEVPSSLYSFTFSGEPERRKERNVNTHFDVGGKRFESREKAIEQVKEWNADTRKFHVHEVAQTEVTRKTAKGKVLTEVVRGSLDGVPRIVFVRELSPTYVVLDSDGYPLRYQGSDAYFAIRTDAEAERAKLQSGVEKLAAITESDIREVHVPTLADVLGRDEEKLAELQTEVEEARKEWARLREQADSSVASALANLKRQAAVLRAEAANLKAEAAKQFGVENAWEKFYAAIVAFKKAIHFDELEQEVLKKSHEIHRWECFPDSECGSHGQCTFEPDRDEVEEYLLENAEQFEIEEEIGGGDKAKTAAP
jgi:hypothetical protein